MEAENVSNDLFCYTKRDEFTSEIYKIEIGGLPQQFGYGQLKKLLNQKLQLRPHKIKSVGQQSTWAFVTFRCEEDRTRALESLNGYIWRGKALTVKKANPAADPLLKKRKDADFPTESSSKIPKLENINPTEQILNAVMPLWKMPYEEQLKTKEGEVKKVLVKLGRQIDKTSHKPVSWLEENRRANDFMCCEFVGIKPSPVTEHYRNKCEFTIGSEPEEKKITVGFRLSKYADGSMYVGEVSKCNIVPEAVLSVCKALEGYITKTDKLPYNPIDHTGYWKQLTARYTSNGNLMASVIMHPQKLTKEEIHKVKDELREYFFEGDGKDCRITSLYYQSQAKRGVDDDSFEHVHGEKYITETMMGCNFRISPNAFFQINTPAAQVLYSTIIDIANVNENTVVLDICCGTGAIGISLAKKVNRVIGIEMVASAIEDAKYNAQMNGLTNTEFICGKVEDSISSILYKVQGCTDVVAIVDPPRPGLHNKVVRSIRSCKTLNRLVFVACDLSAASTNLVDFCRPESNQYRSKPFTIKKSCAVDLFPHTNHFEVVLLLERTPDPPANVEVKTEPSF